MKVILSARLLASISLAGPWMLGFSMTALPLTVWAQSLPSLEGEEEATEEYPEDEDEYLDEVIATGSRQGYSPAGNIIRDVSFNAGDILALGVTDLGELIDAINAETGSEPSEPPIILLNGRPVSSRKDIRRFPSEAIRRVDVLPPEAALKFSSDANRRVLNFILRRRFDAATGILTAQTTTAGGQNTYSAGGNYLRIRNKTRIALNATLETANHLSEAERDIADRNSNRLFALGGNITALMDGAEIDPDLSTLFGETVFVAGVPLPASMAGLTLEDFREGANNPNVTDQRFFRDLEPETENISLSGSVFRPLANHLSINGSINADFTSSNSLRGFKSTDFIIPATNPFSPFGDDIRLFRYDSPLDRTTSKNDIEVSLTLFGDHADWRWLMEGQFSHVTDKRDTNRGISTSSIRDRILQNDTELNPFAPFDLSALSQNDRTEEVIRLKGRINGKIVSLPAGVATGSISIKYSNASLDAATQFNGELSEANFSRDVKLSRAEIDIPLIGPKNGRGRRAAGRVSLRVNGGLSSVENFGTLVSYGTGVSWNATNRLFLEGSLNHSERVPSLSQIGNPVLIDPNVRVTDFVADIPVFVDRVTGGNPILKAERRRDMRLTARYRHSRDLSFSTRYRARDTQDAITSFPFLTPQVAGAFPSRLIRDESGNLVELDARPVNASHVERDTLRTGMNWSKRFSNPRTRAVNSQAENGRTRSRRRGNRRSDRIGLSLYHTWRLKDEVQFSENGAIFDLLDGAALRRRSGTADHQIEARASFTHKKIGGALLFNHETGSTIDTGFLSGNQAAGGALSFEPLTTADLRLYYDLGRKSNGRQVARNDWRRGLRLSLNIINLTNEKQSVSSPQGFVPFGYEQDALDPSGRTVMFSIRKLYSGLGKTRNAK